jgi:hypothetical protein
VNYLRRLPRGTQGVSKGAQAKRRQNAERIAMQIAVKILLPMLFCVMPALFCRIRRPGAQHLRNAFFKSGGF